QGTAGGDRELSSARARWRAQVPTARASSAGDAAARRRRTQGTATSLLQWHDDRRDALRARPPRYRHGGCGAGPCRAVRRHDRHSPGLERPSRRPPQSHPGEGVSMDAITIQVLRNKIASLVDEMHYHFYRSGYSTIIRESRDFSCVILDRDGRLIVA